jgi:serine/threonine-protein kinase HipA
VSNTDDHLRNHGFLRDERGWRLAPAYDLNPTPVDVKPRVQTLAINESDATSSLETAFEVAPRFGLAPAEARAVAARSGGPCGGGDRPGRSSASSAGTSIAWRAAFEHNDLALAGG